MSNSNGFFENFFTKIIYGMVYYPIRFIIVSLYFAFVTAIVTTLWIIGILFAFSVNDVFGWIVLILGLLAVFFALTDFIPKVPAIKNTSLKLAPVVADSNRRKNSKETIKSVVMGNNILKEMGIIGKDDATVYGVSAIENNGDFTLEFLTNKKYQEFQLNANEFKVLEEYAIDKFGADYITIEDNYKTANAAGRIVFNSSDVDPSQRTGNELLISAGLKQSNDRNFYPVLVEQDDHGVVVNVMEQIGHHSVATVVENLSKLHDKFGAKYIEVEKDSRSFVKMRFVNRINKARGDGNDFLRESGVVQRNDRVLYNVDLVKTNDQVSLDIKEPLPGITSERIMSTISGFKERFNATTVRSENLGNGKVRVDFIIRDFLDDGKTINKFPELDLKDMSIPCAVDAFGNEVRIKFKECSGMVVAGIPGSGKTAGVSSILGAPAISDDVEMSIIDGKGGSDWESYAPLVANYIQGDEDLVPIVDLLQEYVDSMVSRVQSMKKTIGNSNFWNVSPEKRRAAGLKLKILVIDECQGLFESRSGSPETRKQLAQILELSSKLVRRGRSAGITVIFITQKSTSDSIPTTIRDNAALRIAFRLLSSAAELAALGEVADQPNAPRPMDIPAHRKGGAVMATDSGDLTAVRFYYIPEEIQEAIFNKKASSTVEDKNIEMVKKMMKRATEAEAEEKGAGAKFKASAEAMMANYGLTEADII